MKKFRNILAVALILCLMAGLMPMAAFANDANIEDNAGEAGSTVEEVVGSPTGDVGSGNNEGGANDSSGSGGETGSADVLAAGSPAGDAGAAGNNAADNAVPAESTSDSGLPQAPEAFTDIAPVAPVAPAEPDLNGLSDEAANEKIRLYNAEVERYNEAAEQYNAEFDAYEAAAEEYNASVENYNDRAASYNAKADEHNQAEQKKLDDYHAAMEDYNQKAGPIIERQKKIDIISDRNMTMAKEQMESLGDIGRLDKESILSLGTVLEEDYTVNYGWHSSTIGRAGDLVISWDDLVPGNDRNTIQIQAGEKSDEIYKVANLHIFEDFADFIEMSDYQSERGWDCMNINVDDANGVIIIPKALIDRIAMIEIEVAEVGKNDTVTVLGQNNLFKSGENVTAMASRFFDGYTDGPYWYSAGTIFQSTAAYSESDGMGTAHTFSYSEGTTDRAEIKNPLNVNHYVFQRYGSKPLPEKPEEVTVNMMDKAENLSFIQILGAKLSRLLGLPEREIKLKEDSTPAIPVVPEVSDITAGNPVPETPVIPPVDPAPAAPVIPSVVEIPEEVTPLAKPEQKDEELSEIPSLVTIAAENTDGHHSTLVHYEVEEEIVDDETPLAAGASWALVNLIASLLTVVLAMVSLVSRCEKKEDTNEKETRIRLGLVIPAAVSVILFILTEDMRNPMAMVDAWTPVMLVILMANCLMVLASSRKNGKERSRI